MESFEILSILESCITLQHKKENIMIIAIPVAEEKLCSHFGHCDQFALVEVDNENKQILKTVTLDAPPHQPGLLPVWLQDRGVNVVIAGGMGGRAQELFKQKNIQVLVGAPVDTPESLVLQFLNNTLIQGINHCDH
jgi:predicted Fe-Mo cluster-binding NifX family protein